MLDFINCHENAYVLLGSQNILKEICNIIPIQVP